MTEKPRFVTGLVLSLCWTFPFAAGQQAAPVGKGASALPEGAIARFGNTNKSHAVAISPDSKILALADSDAIHLCDLKTGKELRSLEHDYSLGLTFIPPEGKLLASVNSDTLALWDVANGKALYTLPMVARSSPGRSLSPRTARYWPRQTWPPGLSASGG